jgi:hypothetical protein
MDWCIVGEFVGFGDGVVLLEGAGAANVDVGCGEGEEMEDEEPWRRHRGGVKSCLGRIKPFSCFRRRTGVCSLCT